MKRLVIHLSVALFTCLLGLALTLFCPHNLLPDAALLSANISNTFPEASASKSSLPSQEQTTAVNALGKGTLSITDICTPIEKLRYKEYEAASFFNSESGQSFMTIRKNGKLMAKVNGYPDGILERKGMRLGSFQLLGKQTKQLILAQFSGGAHCCYSFWIYDLYPKFRLIFESENYPIEDYMEVARFLDIDEDGVFEFEAPVNSFAYFHSVFSGSVMPDVAFKYDRKARRYNPANQLFIARALNGIEAELHQVRESNVKIAAGEIPGLDYLYYVLDIVLRHIYAGKEKEAWSFYNQEYKFEWFVKKEELRKEIKEILDKDSIYRFIYRR